MLEAKIALAAQPPPSAGRPESLPAPALVVTFKLGEQTYGLPVNVVLEIVRLPALLPLSGMAPEVCGLLNLRGRYVPILAGHLLVGLPFTYDLNSQVIIGGHNEAQVGLLVDMVQDVQTLPAHQITRFQNHPAAFLAGVVDMGDNSLLLFDFKALLTLTETCL